LTQPTTVNRFGMLSTWEDVCHGGHCFLLCGGPSIHTIVPDKSVLQHRGIVTFAFNNVAALVRPNFWTYGDSTRKFHDAIWKDPGIIKFVPYPKMDNKVREKRPDAGFVETELRPRQCPGIVGISRNSDMNPEGYLTEDTINWGVGADSLVRRLTPWLKENLKLPDDQLKWKHVRPLIDSGRVPSDVFHSLCPYPKVLSTMFQAVRLVYFLGFRVCYLLGADFSMGQEQHYAFDETGNPGTVRGNNGSYPKINEIFGVLRPHFDAANFQVFNCNPRSQLMAFDYIDFADAYGWATELMPKSIDTSGWYEKD